MVRPSASLLALARQSPRLSGLPNRLPTRGPAFLPSASPLASTSSCISSQLSSATHGPQQRRGIVLHAQPPAEEPEEPLEGEAVIDLTESAIARIAWAQDKASDPLLSLRLAVESGGCHGYQYKMEVTTHAEPEDYVFLAPNSPARVLIDSSSLELVSGSTIDYATELIGSSFRVKDNPHASDKGGCGCGVSWELKE